MTRRNICRSIVGLAALLTLTMAVSAWAHGPSRGGFGGPGLLGIKSGGPAGGLLQELIYPCQADCANNARTCSDTADADALTCISGACATEIQTAQSECATDRGAQTCKDAVTALRTCAQSCLSTRQTALTACRDALGSCREACSPTPTPTP
jgi:hypothetical protein